MSADLNWNKLKIQNIIKKWLRNGIKRDSLQKFFLFVFFGEGVVPKYFSQKVSTLLLIQFLIVISC